MADEEKQEGAAAAQEAPKKEAVVEETVEVPEKFKGLVEDIEKLTVLELSELVKALEKKFGVSAAAPTAAAAAPSAAPAEGGAEEKSSYNIQLTGIGEQKIEVIKVVRDATQKGLKEAKDLVDAAASQPQMVREGASKEEAEDLKKKFEAAGATVELQ